ncbi:MAG TPA: aldehyde reductase [Polyangiaceae bacterium]|nr:aldehyde reductase [Polyangiaceae bacterium]
MTGASGFIALHCVRELLERGYRVRGTVRDLLAEAALRRALLPLEPGERLSFARAELLSDDGWAEALAGARYVLHVASPLPKAVPKDENELIRPAREGALRVLRFARAEGVQRVVLTSSMAAVSSGRRRDQGHVFDENDWADLSQPVPPYEKSKTLAERAAWDYVRGEGRPLELVAMNPVFVLGPSLTGTDNASNEIVGKLVRREMPGIPRLHLPVVDVRDVATAHVLAMTQANAAGQRYILASETAWMKDIADTLAAAGYRVPTRVVPDFVARVAALFDPTVRLVVPRLGKLSLVTSEKARRELGWSGRSMREMVLDTAQHFRARRAKARD